MDLTKTKTFTLQLTLTVIGLIISYYTGIFLYNTTVNTYLKLFPPAPVTPESKFGKLPQLKFKSIEIKGSPSYTLSTETAKLPNFPDRFKVYKINEPKTSLLSENYIKQIAKDLGFTSDFIKLNASEVEWVDGNNKRSLRANIASKNFDLSADYAKVESALSNTTTITSKDATTKAFNYIKAKGIFTNEELAAYSIGYLPLNIKFGKLQDLTEFPNQAKIYKVDFYREVPITDPKSPSNRPKILTSYRIYNENYDDSNVSFYVTNDAGSFKFPFINVNIWPVDYANGSEYFLSNIAAVWQAVTQQKGVIAKAKLDTSDHFDTTPIQELDKIDIREVKLGYYEPKEFLAYLQPIYVFKGVFTTKPAGSETSRTGEIVIYYPAVRGDYIQPSK